MNVVCLDLEGVLVPEIWIAFAKESGISVLSRTTRDEPDYDKLMNWRLGILKEHGLKLEDIQKHYFKDRPAGGCKGISGQAPRAYSGHHRQRHLYPVCSAPYEKAWNAHYFLQRAGSGRGWRDHRLQNACGKLQVYHRHSFAGHGL